MKMWQLCLILSAMTCNTMIILEKIGEEDNFITWVVIIFFIMSLVSSAIMRDE